MPCFFNIFNLEKGPPATRLSQGMANTRETGSEFEQDLHDAVKRKGSSHGKKGSTRWMLCVGCVLGAEWREEARWMESKVEAEVERGAERGAR